MFCSDCMQCSAIPLQLYFVTTLLFEFCGKFRPHHGGHSAPSCIDWIVSTLAHEPSKAKIAARQSLGWKLFVEHNNASGTLTDKTKCRCCTCHSTANNDYIHFLHSLISICIEQHPVVRGTQSIKFSLFISLPISCHFGFSLLAPHNSRDFLTLIHL